MPGSTVRAGASVLTLVLLLLIGACSTPVTEPPATWASEATDSTPTATAIPPTSTLTPTATAIPPTPTLAPTATAVPPTPTLTPTATAIPPTQTLTPTATAVPPTPTLTPTATAIPPTPTLTPTATAVPPTPTLTLTATAVPPTPTLTPTATAVPPTPTLTPTATAIPPTSTPTPTPTQIPGRTDLYEKVALPEHMAYIWWGWTQAQDDRGFEELEVAFTVHNDVGDMPGLDGLYLMVCYGKIAETPFYLGIQTNAHSATLPFYGRGKAAIFSRWETRDLELARFSEEDGWTQSSGHEGDFIGVRRSYDWGPGEYIARLGPDGEDRDGVWFGLWITDQRTGTETWIGSMKFPKVKGAARIGGPVYSTMDVYGGTPIRPIDIPEWHVTMSRPSGDGRPARRGATGYSMFGAEILNSNIRYARRQDVVDIRAGGLTERTTAPGDIRFK